MRIGLLEAGRSATPRFARHGPYPEMFVRLFQAVDDGLHFETYAALDDELPAGVADCDAYVITGSPNGVYDRLPWMAALQAFAQRGCL